MRCSLYVVMLLAVGLASVRPARACGVERWQVKTGTDSDAGLVNLNSSTPSSVAALIALAAPNPIPPTNRVQPTETTVWTLNATLTEFKLEGDQDIHLVIVDSAGNSMIAEIPDPNCVASGSPFAAAIANAHSEFTAQYAPGPNFQAVNVPVQIKGVAMFDFLHGQTGVAPNGMELHPVLDVAFTSGPNDFSVAAAPSAVLLAPGGNATVNITVGATGSFSSPVALSAGAPAGITAAFNPATVTPPGTASLVLSADPSAPPGTFTVAVNGTSGGNTHGAALAATVAGAPGDFSVSTGMKVGLGDTVSAPVWTSITGGFNADVSLSAPNLPAGISATFNPPSIGAPGAGLSTISITADPSAAPGTYALTLQGASGAATHSTTLALNVFPAAAPAARPSSLHATPAPEAQFRSLLMATNEARDEDDALVSLVPSEAFGQRARRHGGNLVCNPPQVHVFLGSAWRQSQNRARQNALSSLVISPIADLCPGARRTVPRNYLEPADLGHKPLTDLEVQARLAAMLRERRLTLSNTAIYVVFLPPGTSSAVGRAVAGQDYLAYHSHFHSDYGEVHYVVVPFSDNERLQKRAATRSILEASLNPEGQW